MKKWEYMVTDVHAAQEEVDDMDMNGKDGWELVTVRERAHTVRFYYKRELKDEG